MTEYSPIRLAVIGLGGMGRFHLDTFRSLQPWVHVSAIADPYPPFVDHCRALAPGAVTFDDPIECLAVGRFGRSPGRDRRRHALCYRSRLPRSQNPGAVREATDDLAETLARPRAR